MLLFFCCCLFVCFCFVLFFVCFLFCFLFVCLFVFLCCFFFLLFFFFFFCGGGGGGEGFTVLSRLFHLYHGRSFIKGGRKPEKPRKNHLTIGKQNVAFPYVTRAWFEPQRWETEWIKSQLSYPLGPGAGIMHYSEISEGWSWPYLARRPFSHC